MDAEQVSGTVCDDSMDAKQVVEVAPSNPTTPCAWPQGVPGTAGGRAGALVTDSTAARGHTSSMAFCVAVAVAPPPGVWSDRPNAADDHLRRGDTVASSAPGTGRVGPFPRGAVPRLTTGALASASGAGSMSPPFAPADPDF